MSKHDVLLDVAVEMYSMDSETFNVDNLRARVGPFADSKPFSKITEDVINRAVDTPDSPHSRRAILRASLDRRVQHLIPIRSYRLALFDAAEATFDTTPITFTPALTPQQQIAADFIAKYAIHTGDETDVMHLNPLYEEYVRHTKIDVMKRAVFTLFSKSQMKTRFKRNLKADGRVTSGWRGYRPAVSGVDTLFATK